GCCITRIQKKEGGARHVARRQHPDALDRHGCEALSRAGWSTVVMDRPKGSGAVEPATHAANAGCMRRRAPKSALRRVERGLLRQNASRVMQGQEREQEGNDVQRL